MNCFKDADTSASAPLEILKISPELEKSAVERLRSYRSKRSQAASQDAIRSLSEGAQGDANLQALILNAVKAGATLGEIADTLRDTFGLYREYAGF